MCFFCCFFWIVVVVEVIFFLEGGKVLGIGGSWGRLYVGCWFIYFFSEGKKSEF